MSLLKFGVKYSESNKFPRKIKNISNPPLKCQGIKTKLVNFIATNISWDGNGYWIEPFFGSGSVGLNIRHPKAIFSDNNPHLIRFYSDLQSGKIDPIMIRDALIDLGKKLRKGKDDFYYKMRDEFNKTNDPILFLFINRAGYNGLIRFNNKGNCNTPFGHLPNRFSEAYVTKIFHYLQRARTILQSNECHLECCEWQKTLDRVKENDFVYLDPPYPDLNTNYFTCWSEKDTDEIYQWTSNAKCKWALSSWADNGVRENEVIKKWKDYPIRFFDHYYYIGPKEENRRNIKEVLILSK